MHVTCRGIPWAQVGHTGEDKHARDVPFLDSYASKRWEVKRRFHVSSLVTSCVVLSTGHLKLHG